MECSGEHAYASIFCSPLHIDTYANTIIVDGLVWLSGFVCVATHTVCMCVYECTNCICNSLFM